MNENSFQLKNACTVKLNQEEQAYATEQINEMHPEYDQFTTFKTVFNDLLYRATAKTKQTNVQRPEDAQVIQARENEIGRLKILLDQKDESIIELKEALSVKIEQFTELTQTVHEPGEFLQINQAVITYPQVVLRTFDIEIKEAKKKTGKDFSKEELLLGLYWEAVDKGVAYPYKIWSKSELKAIGVVFNKETEAVNE